MLKRIQASRCPAELCIPPVECSRSPSVGGMPMAPVHCQTPSPTSVSVRRWGKAQTASPTPPLHTPTPAAVTQVRPPLTWTDDSDGCPTAVILLCFVESLIPGTHLMVALKVLTVPVIWILSSSQCSKLPLCQLQQSRAKRCAPARQLEGCTHLGIVPLRQSPFATQPAATGTQPRSSAWQMAW